MAPAPFPPPALPFLPSKSFAFSSPFSHLALVSLTRVYLAYQVYGVDISPPMLDAARQRAALATAPTPTARPTFLCGPLEHCPLDDALADVVISNGALNLCVDKEAALGKVRPCPHSSLRSL